MLFESFRLSPLLIVLVACAPGIAAWWNGRGLSRHLEDPTLPELLMARRQRLLLVVATSMAVLIVLGGVRAFWAVPLAVVMLLAGGFPLRRILLFESGGVVSYVWRGIKSIIAALGFWVLLACAPVIVLAIDAPLWPISVVLLPILLLWEHAYPRLWLWLHDAVPLESEALAPRIAAIVRRAGLQAPELYRLGAPGTRFVNAFALPSLRQPAIGLGNALLELLEPDEAAAIYAHELAHIEQFSARVLRRLQLVTRLLIVLGVGTPLLMRLFAPAVPTEWLTIVWPVIVVAELMRRARRSQQRETESDLRAAALCGDAETVTRALIKLHVHALIPRRRPIDLERSSSHPSLARRIQALRSEGDHAVATIGEPILLATAREGSVVAFEDARAWWFEGIPPGTKPDLEVLRAHASSMRSVAWSELVELRVTARGVDRSLRAVLRNGDRWSVPIAASNVAAVQKALDGVDVRLSRELGRRVPRSGPLAAAATLAAMLVSGQVGILLVPLLLVLARPGTAALAALGAMTTGHAILVWVLGQAASSLGRSAIGVAALGVLGVVTLALAWRQLNTTGGRDDTRLTLYVLGTVGSILLVIVGVAVWSLPARELPEFPLIPTLTVTLLGLGAALATSRSRATRWCGAASAVAAVLMASQVVVSAARLEGGITLMRIRAQAIEIGRVNLGVSATQLALSPGGTRFLVHLLDSGAEHTSSRAPSSSWIIGALDGTRRVIDAGQVAFLDDTHVFVLRPSETTLELRLERADSTETIWTTQLPWIWNARLGVSCDDRTWAVIGEDTATDSLIVLSGNASSAAVRVHHFPDLDSLVPIDYLIFDGGARLIIPVFDTQFRLGGLPLPLMLLAGASYRSVLWEASADGLRRSGQLPGIPQCGQPELGRAACIVLDGRRSRIWSLNAAGEATHVGTIVRPSPTGTVGPGLHVTALTGRSTVSHFDLSSGRLFDIRLPPGPVSGVAYEAKSTAGRLVVLRHEDDATRVVFFRVE